MKNSLKIVPLTTSLGAEIRGVNLAELQLEDVADFVDLLNLHKVLLFPDQSLTVDQHVAFGAEPDKANIVVAVLAPASSDLTPVVV